MKCPSCGRSNRSGVSFCEECGNRLVISGPCGHDNRPGVAFCEECGARLIVEVDQPTVETAPVASGTAAPCGHVNRAGITFCEECGQRLGTEPKQRNTTQSAEPTNRRLRRRIGAIAAALIGAAAVGSLFVLRSGGEPTPRELIDQLSEPAAVQTCSALAGTAGNFARAAAAVATDEPALNPELVSLGTAYDERTNRLGCSDEEIGAAVRPTSRPSATGPDDLVEYVLRGGDAEYPDDTPRFISAGGSG